MNLYHADADTNLVTKASHYSVGETMHIFARIDHSGEAKKAGLEMKPAVLLIFGNPKGGVPKDLAATLDPVRKVLEQAVE